LWRLEHSAVDVAAADVTILNGYGNSLMDIICRDACSGHDIAKMLALSILDSVLSLDKQSVWLKFISSK
jgi:nuclear pore complex protein Nup205